MTTIVKAASAAQFLSLVPHLVGCVPRDSLVLIPFAGGRSLGGIRVDLPPEDADVESLSATYLGLVCRLPTADGVAAVLYTDDTFAGRSGARSGAGRSAPAGGGRSAPAGGGRSAPAAAGIGDGPRGGGGRRRGGARLGAGGGRLPREDLARALLLRADECGLHVSNVLCVAADGWGSYLDPDCPRSGRSLDELSAENHTPAELPPAPVGDQRAGALLPVIDPVERERVAVALRALEDGVQLLCGPQAGAKGDAEPSLRRAAQTRVDPRALAAVCTLDDLPSLFEDVLESDITRGDCYLAAAIIWCLARPALRDIALVQWCADVSAGDEALDAQLRWEDGAEYPAHLAMHMWGEGRRPDPARLEAALTVARWAAGTAPREARSGPLATCAWLSWALGRSTHAEYYADEARAIEPEHGLAEIVCSFVSAGHLPDWAFRSVGAL